MQYDLDDPNVIAGYHGRYRFLSNFYRGIEPIRVVYQDTEFYVPTSEHGYQTEKTIELRQKLWIAVQETPGRAKRAGRKVTLRGGWDEREAIRMMEKWVDLKFSQRIMREYLLSTGNKILVEVNSHNDQFWGTDEFGEGENNLGLIQMAYRDNLAASLRL